MKAKTFNDRQNYMIKKSIQNYLAVLEKQLETLREQKNSLQQEIYERTTDIIKAQINDIDEILKCARYTGK